MKTLDVKEKYKTDYCIPIWLRDEQIKLACSLEIPRLQPDSTLHPEPIAIACFGPSLNDTWEEIRSFPKVITCSGSHRFLIDRGIIPTWHVEVDPRKHKIDLLGTPHPDVTYLVASTCHPLYFKHLMSAGAKVLLWHVFSNDEEAYRTLPRGEWAITGGTNVGLRCMTIGRFFGYRDQHIFGMDGCQRDDTHKHASPHPLQDGSGFALVDYEGKTYKTTPAMLESAKLTFHELDELVDVKATFHGEGLVQEMAKKYVKGSPKQSGVIAFNTPETISAEYRELNRQLHRDRLEYGVGGGRYAPTVLKLAESLKTTSVLDYGCGKGYLARAMPYPIWEYDPAIYGKDQPPRPADLVVCIDTLEHIEPDKLLAVLADLSRCTKQVGYFVIHTGPSKKTLSDGRNAHLIQKPKKWWSKRIALFFNVAKVFEQGPLLHYVVSPKAQAKKIERVA